MIDTRERMRCTKCRCRIIVGSTTGGPLVYCDRCALVYRNKSLLRDRRSGASKRLDEIFSAMETS